jgi:hypothetical protein
MSKKQRKTRISTVRIGEVPTPERRRHNGGVACENVDRDVNGRVLVKRYKSVWDCPLDAYRSRDVITETEHHAGLKFRYAYFRAVLGIRVEDIGSGSKEDTEMAFLSPIYSERLLNEAYEALSPKQKDIVIDVCGHDECAGETAKLKTLHRALEKLCEIWEINGLD